MLQLGYDLSYQPCPNLTQPTLLPNCLHNHYMNEETGNQILFIQVLFMK